MEVTLDGREQVIRVDGVEVDRLRPGDFASAKTDDALAADLAARIADEAGRKLPPEKRPTVLIHFYPDGGLEKAREERYVVGVKPPGWALPAEAAKRGLAWWQMPPTDDEKQENERGV